MLGGFEWLVLDKHLKAAFAVRYVVCLPLLLLALSVAATKWLERYVRLPLVSGALVAGGGSLSIDNVFGSGTTVNASFPAERCVPYPAGAKRPAPISPAQAPS